ncbi:hypothetical protein [Streptomyces fagopyri]|uniref:hypothetical protein n=1 Tax=Streptomyces fagopyri TaxID=2662397 RepID=UPI00382AD033
MLAFLVFAVGRLVGFCGGFACRFAAVSLGVGADGGKVGADGRQLVDEQFPVFAECPPDDFLGVVEGVAGDGLSAVDGVLLIPCSCWLLSLPNVAAPLVVG